MNASQGRNALAFHKLNRQLARLGDKPKPESVHRFRTLSRRVEALVEGLITEPAGNDKKLLDLLARLRKKAGKLRDLDVQIAALRNLRMPQDRSRKSELLQALCFERQKRETRLASTFNEDTLHELSKRLKRASKSLPNGSDPLAPAVRQLHALVQEPAPITEATLHRYRILGKRVRYLAELCFNDPHAREIVSRLKQVQDAIGDWHDWLKLNKKAGKFFADAQDSGLLSTLRTITRNKFLQAVDILIRARAELASSTRKPAKSIGSAQVRKATA